MYFSYDEQNRLISLTYNGSEYFYITNLQGDIIGLIDENGNLVVEYAYDAWGKVISITGDLAETLGKANPMRYRSYYYDSDTGYYYLQSRYYTPDTGRFLNADNPLLSGLSAGNLIGTNLFVYCYNTPVNYSDPTGYYVTSLALPAASILSLSGALPGIITGISVSIASIKTAIASSWLVAVCVAATLVAIAGIVYTVNKVKALSAASASTISAVKSKVNSGGLDTKKL